MSLNEEMIQPTSESFWEVGQYKRTVKRHEDGQRLCNDLMSLIQERADIEKHYAKELRQWSKKWNDHLDKGPEYGTTLGAWKALLAEADELSEIHMNIKQNLVEGVKSDVQVWKNDNYKKAMMGPSKETKDLEDQFRKAQKPWGKSYAKVIEAKKKHHIACKTEKTATNQENNARSDSTISPDNLKKLQDKVEKARRDVESTRDKYEVALKDLNGRNGRYMEDMAEVFEKSQDYEEKRLKFFKDMLFGVHQSLDISNNVKIQQIYAQLHHTIEQADYQKDLKYWSMNHGTEMAMKWPDFEEYSPEFNTISRKENKRGVTAHNEGITLTSIHNKETYRGDISQPMPVQEAYNTQNNTAPAVAPAIAPAAAAAVMPQRPPLPGTPPRKPPRTRQVSYDDSLNPFADDDEVDSDTNVVTSANSTPQATPQKSTNPFSDDEDEDQEEADKNNHCENSSQYSASSEGLSVNSDAKGVNISASSEKLDSNDGEKEDGPSGEDVEDKDGFNDARSETSPVKEKEGSPAKEKEGSPAKDTDETT